MDAADQVDEDLGASPYSPEDATRLFQAALKIIDESPGRLALRMQRLGDHRPLGTITRAIQRMAAGETKVSGEMQVVVQLLVRERERAAEDVMRLRWSQVGKTMTAATRDFTITLSPQSRGRWKVSVTHVPTRYSPDWPVSQTSLEDAKVKAILCIEDALHATDPKLTPSPFEQPDLPAVTGTDYLAMAKAMNQVARDTLRIQTEGATALAAKIAIGLSLQVARLAGEAVLVHLGWPVEDVRKCRNHDLLTILHQAETAIQESGDPSLKPYAHFTLVSPIVNGKKLGGSIAGYLQTHLAQGGPAAPENYLNADEPHFSRPVPIHAVCEMADQLIEAAGKVVGGDAVT